MADRNTKIRGIQIYADVAGSGLAKDGSGNLAINLETSNPGLAIADDKLDIKLVTNDGLEKGVSGVTVAYDDATIGIVSNHLAVKNAGIGTTQLSIGVNASLGKADSAIQTELDPVFSAWDKSTGISITESQISDLQDYVLKSSVDNVTLELTTPDVLQVKDGGITEPKLAMNDSPSAGEVITWNASGYMEWTAKTATDAVAESDLVMENLSVTCDGIETDFVLDYTPVANSLQVFLNGLLQEEGTGKDYLIATATVTFVTAPASGDILIVHYVK